MLSLSWSSWKEATGAGLLPLGHSSFCPSAGTACLGHPPVAHRFLRAHVCFAPYKLYE